MTESGTATSTQHVKWTRWEKHGDHPDDIEWEPQAHMEKYFPQNLGLIRTTESAKTGTLSWIAPSNYIVEHLHSCEHCGGKLEEHDVGGEVFELTGGNPSSLPSVVLGCENCEELSEHTTLETGEIEVLTEQEFNKRFKKNQGDE